MIVLLNPEDIGIGGNANPRDDVDLVNQFSAAVSDAIKFADIALYLDPNGQIRIIKDRHGRFHQESPDRIKWPEFPVRQDPGPDHSPESPMGRLNAMFNLG